MAIGKKRRELAITIIDSNTSVAEEAHAHHHDHAEEGPRSLGRPAPCYLYVGETAISESDIAREMQFHRAMKPEISRANAARALVVRELLRHESKRLGLATSVQALAGETDEEACIRVLLEGEVEHRIPDEADCLRYYEQNPERFHSPRRMQVRHILLAAAPADVNARLKARSTGESLIAELKTQPHLFADFAARYSDCPSKTEGGDLGWLEHGQTTPEFDRQVFRLREGIAAFPVESRWGYHVVCVDAIAGGEELAFDQVRQRISDYLELQLRQRELQQYLQGLQERFEVRGLDAIEAAVG